MSAIATALLEELKRLKYEGVTDIAISDETLQSLRQLTTAKVGASLDDARRQPADTQTPPDISSPADTPQIAKSTTAPAAPIQNPKPKIQNPFPPPPPIKLPATPEKQPRWDALRDHVLNDPVCQKNVRPGKKIVLGVGNLDAKIMFIGEAPGADEEIQGEPFVGPAGQLLTKMIQGMGLRRDQVYIGNIMNWRPQIPAPDGREQIGNRPPTPEEMAYCLPNLRAQIDIIDPAIIVALGATAAHGLLGNDAFQTLGEIRGQWKTYAGKPLLVTYHPSYILRNGSTRSKRAIWEDLLSVMQRADLPISEKQKNYFKT